MNIGIIMFKRFYDKRDMIGVFGSIRMEFLKKEMIHGKKKRMRIQLIFQS